MFSDILKDKRFNIFFSFIVGIFIAVLLKPQFHKDKLIFFKPPPMTEIRSNSYKIGAKCYKFHPEAVTCPETGVIEPFLQINRA